MKKLLIISYCFPPCNLTSSQRVLSWAKYLHLHGWFPIIICRKWEKEIEVNSDQYSSTNLKEVEHVMNENYEIYWLPYKSNFRDKLLISNKFKFLRKIVSLIYLFLEKPMVWFDSLGIYQRFMISYLAKNKVNGVYITANPYVLFRLGYVSNKKYGIKWAADYRDAWSNSQLNYPKNILGKLLQTFDEYFEKKWLQTASFITTISKEYVEQIGDYLGKPAKVIYNGYFKDEFKNLEETNQYSIFTITYVGSLYKEQNIEIFLSAVLRLIRSNPKLQLQMLFPGLTYVPGQAERILIYVKGYEQYFKITDRVARSDILEIQNKSHVLLHVGWQNHEGVVGSKIYEYIATGRPIIICPSDQGVLKEKIKETNAGVVVQNEDEAFSFLKKLYELYEKNEDYSFNINRENVESYSRENQTKILAQYLDKYFV